MLNYIKNLSINTFIRTIILIEIIFLIMIFFIALRIESTRKEIINTANQRFASAQLAYELKESSDNLTMMARLYTITGNTIYKQYFFDILAIRDGELPKPIDYTTFYWDILLGTNQSPVFSGSKESFISRVKQLNMTEYENHLLALSLERSNSLVNFEHKAFYTVEGLYPDDKGNYTIHGKPDSDLARSMLHSKRYFNAKSRIMKPISEFSNSINRRFQNEYNKLEINQFYNILYLEFCVGINILFAFVAFLFLNHTLRQLQELTDHVNIILSRNYNARNRVTVKNELGLLGNALNQMCDSILYNINEHKIINASLKESEERFRGMVENSPVGTYITTLEGKIIFVNDALCKLLGYSKNEFLEMKIKDIIYSEDMPKTLNLIHQLIALKINFFRLYQRHIHKNAHPVWTLLNITTIKSADGKPFQLIGQLQDISERVRNEERMAKLNNSLVTAVKELKQAEHDESLINRMNELLQICINSNEAYPRISQIAKELFPDLSGALSILNKSMQMMETVEQWGKEKLMNETFSPNDCFSIRSGDIMHIDDPSTSSICNHYISPPKGGILKLPMLAQGDIIGIMSFFAPSGKMITKKQKQLAIIFNNTVKTALANIRLRELLRELSIHDPLTGLFNRRYLDETLPHILQYALRNKRKFCLAMLDLDFFKQFNDTCGHEAGDELLKFIGKFLQQNFRGSDIACRFGGEEFLVTLLDSNLDSTIKKMEYIRNGIKNTQLFFQGKALPHITISIGIAASPDHATTEEGLILAADQALYSAKQSGRDRVVVYQMKDNPDKK